MLDNRPPEWIYETDYFDDEDVMLPDTNVLPIFILEQFFTMDELMEVYDLVNTKRRKEYIQGDLERVRNFKLSSMSCFPRLIEIVRNFYRANDMPYDNITTLSEQLLTGPPGNEGQFLHLDTWHKFATVIIYLTKGKSTKFAKFQYCDVSRDEPVGPELYPCEWDNEKTYQWNVGVGDMVVFWSNFPHTAPSNMSNKPHIKYYGVHNHSLEKMTT